MRRRRGECRGAAKDPFIPSTSFFAAGSFLPAAAFLNGGFFAAGRAFVWRHYAPPCIFMLAIAVRARAFCAAKTAGAAPESAENNKKNGFLSQKTGGKQILFKHLPTRIKLCIIEWKITIRVKIYAKRLEACKFRP